MTLASSPVELWYVSAGHGMAVMLLLLPPFSTCQAGGRVKQAVGQVCHLDV